MRAGVDAGPRKRLQEFRGLLAIGAALVRVNGDQDHIGLSAPAAHLLEDRPLITFVRGREDPRDAALAEGVAEEPQAALGGRATGAAARQEALGFAQAASRSAGARRCDARATDSDRGVPGSPRAPDSPHSPPGMSRRSR